MNIRNRKCFYFIAAFLLLIAVNGCSLKSDKPILDNTSIDGSPSAEQSQTVEKDTLTEESDEQESLFSKDSETTQTDSKDTESEVIKPAATKEIYIYTINESTQDVESAVALVPENSEITPQLIINLVEDSLADRLITVGIDEVTTQKDEVIVSFKSGQPPLINVGSGLEKTILDAIAQSLVDNLEDYPKVVFRVQGKAYSSGHFSFGLNEVYLENSKTK